MRYVLLVFATFLSSCITASGQRLDNVSSAPAKIVNFSFTLNDECSTSAGVYMGDKLLRTLWSNVTYPAGIHVAVWDGRDDNGLPVNDTNFQIHVLNSRVKYEYEGVIGNSSELLDDTTEHQGLEPIQDMVIIDTVAYFVTGYSESRTVTYYLNTRNPQKRYPLLSKGVYTSNLATDGKVIYYSGYDFKKSFVFALYAADHLEKKFQAGVSFKARYARAYLSVIDTVEDANSAITGLAVQKKGRFLFVARARLNRIDLLNKETGMLEKTIPIEDPGRMACNDKSLWVISKGQVVEYDVNGGLSFSLLINRFKGLQHALSVCLYEKTVIVNDGGSSQQIKGFTQTGDLLWTKGEQGGYAKNATITNNRFYLQDDKFNTSLRFNTFTTTGPDGSFWVGDVGNNRVMHFDIKWKVIAQIVYRSKSYSCRVDKNDPTRVFSDYLEYVIDYNKPAAFGWRLKSNWAGFVRLQDDNKYLRFRSLATLPNGRTYAIVNNRLVELVGDSLRRTKITVPVYSQLYEDGSLRRITRYTIGRSLEWYCRKLAAFDADNDPMYTDEELAARSSVLNERMPGFRGALTVLRAGEKTASGKYVILDYSKSNTGYHLGAVKEHDSSWIWLTAKSTHSGYRGDYPTDGAFDIGNGVKNPGSSAIALGNNIFWGYYGEFWKNSQTNKWTHVFENGLMVGVFGWAGNDPEAKGDAGNAFSGNVVYKPGDSTVAFLYHNDEGHHGGVHRWKITGLNTIRVQRGMMVETSMSETVKKGIYLDMTDWIASPAEPANTPERLWQVQYGIKSNTSPDLFVKYYNHGICTVSRKIKTTDNWKIKGEISWEGGFDNHDERLQQGGCFFQVLDSADRIIAQLYTVYRSKHEVNVMGNTSTLLSRNQQQIRVFKNHYQPFEIYKNGNLVTCSYSGFTANTPRMDEKSALSSPAKLRLYFFTSGKKATRVIDIRKISVE